MPDPSVDPDLDPNDPDLQDPPTRPLWRRALGWGRDLALLAIVMLVGLAVVGRARAPRLPEVAPEFALTDVDGRQVNLSDFRGQTVVLNFWATWCGPCRAEAPTFAAFAQANPDVPVLGLAVDGPPNKVRRVAQELGMDYRIVSADASVVRDYGISMYPTTVVVGPEGDVRWAHAGVMWRPHLSLATWW